MRRRLALISVVMLTTGCDGFGHAGDTYEKIDFAPGEVTLDAQGLTGHWTVRRGDTPSTGEGGACMVVNLKELEPGLPGPTNEADCRTRAGIAMGAGAYGYFLPDEGPQGQCWIKPKTGTCIRSLDAKALRMPTRWSFDNHVTNATPVPMTNIPGTSRPLPAYTQWRVQACMFVFVDDQLKFDCKWGRAKGFRRPDIVNPNRSPLATS